GDARPDDHQRRVRRARPHHRVRDALRVRPARVARLAASGPPAPLLMTTAPPSPPPSPPSGHVADDRVALRFEGESWTWHEYVRACAQRAAYLRDHLPDGNPPHVGVLLEN